MSKLKATGNCFEHTAHYMMNHQRDDLTLVHCVVTGTGDKVKGLDYCHAFVLHRELLSHTLGDAVVESVIDLTNDYHKPIVAPYEYYKQIGNVKNEIHYHREEVREMLKLHQHCGPWEESLVTPADKEASE